MRYSDTCGLGGVFEEVNVGAIVGAVVNVALGGTVVSVGLRVFVAVGKSGTMVTPGTGVRVATFGTQSSCPA